MASHRSCIHLAFCGLVVLTIGSVAVIMYSQGPLNQPTGYLARLRNFPLQIFKSEDSVGEQAVECVASGAADDVLLVIAFVDSSYGTVPQLERLYRRHFPNILFCGPSDPPDRLKGDFIVVAMQHGVVAYECLGRAIRISPGYKGYLFIRNDLFLNYYKVAGLNRTRIWESAELQSGSQVMFEQPRESWIWWFTPWGLKACERAYRELISLNALYKRDSLDKGGRMEPWDVENALNALLWNGRGKYKCYRGYSQLFYIPAKYATAFEQMSAIFQKHQVYMEVAVPTVIRMLELRAESIPVAGVDITSLYGEERALSDTSLFWRHYDPHMSYVRPAVLKPGSRADADSEILEFLLSRLDGRPDCSLVESRVGSSGDTTTPPSL